MLVFSLPLRAGHVAGRRPVGSVAESGRFPVMVRRSSLSLRRRPAMSSQSSTSCDFDEDDESPLVAMLEVEAA